MVPAKIAAVLALIVSYGALSARQPAVRTSMPLTFDAERLAGVLGIASADRSQLLTSIVRVVFDAPDGSSSHQKRRAALAAQLKLPHVRTATVPLPLDASIWRETILGFPVKDGELAAAILSDRSTALLYYGLSTMDEDTLGWLGPDRETLLHLRRHAGPFASFGRSVKVRGGRVSVPGGKSAEPIWAALVGVDPGRPSIFVQRLFRGSGRLAWFYDTIQHLDGDHQQLVFGGEEPESARIERTRALLDVFESAAPEWQILDRPFVRPTLDPSVVVSLLAVNSDGSLLGPPRRRVWELVFRDRSGEALNADTLGDQSAADNRVIEPSWLARRISLVPAHIGRARLDAFLFAQHRFQGRRSDDATMIGALRGVMAFPALALTLERIGITEPATYAAAARTATTLNGIRGVESRIIALAQFQASLAIVDHAVRDGDLEHDAALAMTSSLVAVPVSSSYGYGDLFAQWLHDQLLPVIDGEKSAGNLDARLAALALAASDVDRLQLQRSIAEILRKTVYSMSLPRLDASEVTDMAARHNFSVADNPTGRAWQLPREDRGERGLRRISGSLLGLDGTLGRPRSATLSTNPLP